MWHAAQYRGEELIVLGHDPRRNDCMLVKLSGLPLNEQHELRRIAASRSGQESTHLIPVLRRMSAPNGADWFTYLAQKMQQRNAPVFTLPIKEIQDSLDDDQKAIFKGYGKGRRNSALDRDDMGRDFTGDDGPEDDLADLKKPNRRVTRDDEDQPNPRQVAPVNSSSLDYKFDLLIETVADENRRTQELLNRLIHALSGPDESSVKKAVPVKRRAPVRAGTSKKRLAEKRAEMEADVHEAQ